MIRPLNRRAGRHQHALGRIALTVTLAVTAGIGTVAGTAVAETPGASADPVVISPGARFVPRATIVLNAGETGFLTAQEGDDRLRWIDYATGATTVLDHRLPEPLAYDVDEFRFAKYPGDFGHGSDTVALYADSPTPQVTLQQRAGGGESATVPIPEGQTYVATYGDTVITRTGAEKAETSLHLLRLENGEVRDQELEGLPEGWDLTISEGDARSVAVRGIKWENTTMSQGWWVVDLATGSVKALSTNGESVSFDQDTVFHLHAPTPYAAQVYRRDDLDAEPTTIDLRDVAYDDTVRRLGDDLVTVSPPNPGDNEYRGNRLLLRDAAGSQKLLLAVASPSLHRTPDGSLLVAGAEKTADGALDWGYYLFTLAADGTVTRKRLADIEDREAEPAGISLGSGILTTADDSQLYNPYTYIGGFRSTWLKTSGRPEELNSTVDGLVSGRDNDCGSTTGPYCVTMFASGDGHHGRKAATEQDVTMLRENGFYSWDARVTSGLSSPELVDLSGRFGVVNQASGGAQAILSFETNSPLQKRAPVAASVWGNTLWSALGGWEDTSTDVPTGVAAKNLTTGAAGDSFDAGCVPAELQAVGRWVYWRCTDDWSGPQGAGVYDRQAKRSLKLGTDDTLLGDGYLVHRSDAVGLTLVDLHNGLPVSGKEADLPQRVVATPADLGDLTGRRSGWTVDRFGGHVAYTGEDRRVRVVPSGVPASAITVIDADTPDMNFTRFSWEPRWWLSKPAASWSLALRNKATGKTVRTLSGGEARGLIAPSWNGTDSAGRLVTNGTYTWTLTAQPADGQGAALTLSGSSAVTTGAAAPRDYAGNDAFGDLLTLASTGDLTIQRGTGTGTLGTKVTGAGWPTSGLKIVPFGDLDGDHCNELVVRLANGSLRSYRPACGRAPTPSTPYTVLGTSGWNQFDTLTAPGDVTGDGLPDLIARNATTGTLYLYKGTSAGKFSAKVKLYDNWKTYTRIIGTGDITGDGIGDLLALDTSRNLYRYDGTGTGTFKARVKVWSNWGAPLNAVVAAGDITGDGRTDLLTRDTAGDLYRNSGDGKGSFTGRVKIATGWQGYKAVL